MLIDIFSRRYEGVALDITDYSVTPKLLMQAYRILAEDAYPTYTGGKVNEKNKAFWQSLHDQLSRELGIAELWQHYLSYATKWNGNDVSQTYEYLPAERCKKWLFDRTKLYDERFLKEGLSLIELGFRRYEGEIAAMNNAPLDDQWDNFLANRPRGGVRLPGNREDGVLFVRKGRTDRFHLAVEELNARFRQAGLTLHYHNCFIQKSSDELSQAEIENPFWNLVSEERWRNVDLDMKEALDRRDSGGRDPAFYAARALESTIKIISDLKEFATGKEKGAHNFIDQLGSKKNALIEKWEADSLKAFFTSVRNPLGHGAGSAEMPKLSSEQTDWAIEFSMSWIKSLIRRL